MSNTVGVGVSNEKRTAISSFDAITVPKNKTRTSANAAEYTSQKKANDDVIAFAFVFRRGLQVTSTT